MPQPMNLKKLALLEAILFTTTEPLTFEELQKLTKSRKDEMDRLLVELNQRCADEARGVKISDIGGYKLVVKSEFMANVTNLTPHADMSRGLLRVLSIIAFHEPIKQSDIVKVIGNRTYDYVHELEERGLIKVEKKSRTRLLSTTPRFEEYFETKREELKKNIEEVKQEAEDEDRLRKEKVGEAGGETKV
ncbi:MAG: SMC-Scp complex subunit ScpB [Candidatus Aenigmarchaeota archaeon]|nr:SMC-Scp complex subunit ScpB [Candidatus Aenigmarchaeota archaeon]